ncbi:amidohydrolase family protein [Terriglobus tenax]|uniref:amidohydrolase family protein n=1 Tax=Terriglobus tenax TaxID=1111115 RepID=UPI0021E0B0D1|nr:amidohydrolase family protein [Terriglobus tenax]
MTKQFFVALAAIGALGAVSAPSPSPQTTAITGAMVFDGTGAAPKVETVLIQNGRIVAVGETVKPPAGATIIDAHGKALTPGLYDLHTHWTPGGEPATVPQIATEYVKSGVTTVNDFNEAPEAFAPLRTWLGTLATPHVNFAARISTPGGHGADWADQATTRWVNTPELARAAIEDLVRYKPDLIKAFTDGWRYGASPDNTSMDGWTLSALTEAAHQQHWKVVTHTVTVDRGVLAARSGVDSLAHGMQDRLLTSEEVAAIKKSGMAEIPTLAVYDPNKDPKHPMNPSDPKDAQRLNKFANAEKNVKMLYDAGVRIAVGTDAGMPMTPHGSSTLHELELLVQSGLTPSQALTAATLESARVIGQDDDRGTIAVGKRADLDLFEGRPWENIADIHTLAMTMIDGKPVWGMQAPQFPATNSATTMPSVAIAAQVDDFERADGRSSLDTLRVDTPDGGLDRTVEISEVVPREEGGHALLISARMATKKDPYAGVAVPLTRGSVQPADVRAFHGVRLDIRGNACTDRLTINGVTGAWTAPLTVSFTWKTVEIPFTSLQPQGRRHPKEWTGNDVTQIEVGGSCAPGTKLWLQLDNLTLY